jgi:hypothetical protein
LIKIVKNKTSNLRKIFYLLLTAQLSTAFPASFLTSKAWVDTNLIKNFKLNFKDYIKINLFILFYTSLIVISLLTFMSYLNLLLIVFSIIFIFSLIYKKYVNHFMYFYFFLLNLFVNCSISFIVIFYVNPEILYENFIYILISSIISIYLNLFSLLPFNIGYTQMVYSITFNYFSLPSDIAVLIASVKQISQVFVVIFMSIYLLKKRHN